MDNGSSDAADDTHSSDDSENQKPSDGFGDSNNSDGSDNSDDSDNSDNSDNLDDPDNKDNPENPDNLDSTDNPNNPDNADDTDNPDSSGDMVMPDDMGILDETEETVESVSENSLEETAEEELIALLAEGDYGVATDSGNCGAEGDNLTWAYYEDSKTLVISGTGEMAYYGSGGPWKKYPFETLVIEEGITKISANAFNTCQSLTGRVCFPATLEEIGANAFNSCEGITELYFADGEGEGKSLTIGNTAFRGNVGLTSIRFPENLTSLKANGSNNSNYNSWYNCGNLKELTIPASLGEVKTSMGFQGMQNLEKLTVEEGITGIERGSFWIDKLVEVRLPEESLTAIADYLFQGASKLEKVNATSDCNVNIPGGVTKIGANAFNTCRSLTGRVCFPAALEEIGENAFNSCEGITELYFADGEGEEKSLTIGNKAFLGDIGLASIRFPENLTSLKSNGSNSVSFGSWYNCRNLKELTIPASLGEVKTSMGFQGMQNLEKLTVEEGITGIERGSFWIDKLVEVRLPEESLTSIADYLFQGASKLEKVNATSDCNVNIPGGVKKIGTNAFNNCRGLTGRVCFPAALEEIGESAFNSCEGITELYFADGEGEEKSLTIGNRAFLGDIGLASIRFPENLTSLTANGSNSVSFGSWYNCRNLKELTIPASLGEVKTSMGFQGMQYLEKLTVEEGITEIESGSFWKNRLVEVRLPEESLTAIADYLFRGADKLERVNATSDCNVNIPGGVTKIGASAFNTCRSLTGRVCFPAALEEIGESAFNSCEGITELYFADGEGEEKSLTIGNTAFLGDIGLASIRFPENLTSLTANGSNSVSFNSWYNCRNLKELTIPASLGEVKSSMGFQGMQYLEKLTVEEGITEIESGSFWKNRLVEVRLPEESLTAIADYLFQNATKLEKINATSDCNVNIPKGIRTIGNSAFYGCTALNGDLVLPDGVTAIGDRAFYGCKGFAEELYLPDHLCTVGDSAFWDCTGLTVIHTSLTPVANIKKYPATFGPAVFHTVWFRGTDDTDDVAADGKSADWASFFKTDFFPAESKIYIDNTVKSLSPRSFWKNYQDFTFVGPNVITIEKTGGENAFSALTAPLNGLEDTYYVTEEGILYALDPVAGTAALAYCPPGITELYIPLYLTATTDMTAAGKENYARSYRVTGVAQHAVMAATDLTSVTAANPQQITLSVRAFADCPTLSVVNGVTTQKEANALFGANGTPAIKRAFINTGLDAETETPVLPGKPMRTLNYTNPSVGKLTVNIRKSSEKLEDRYEEDAYHLLTGEGVAFDLKAEAYGTGNLVAPFRLYFEVGDTDFQGIRTGTQSYTFTSNGTSYTAEVKTVYDRIYGCYCVSFSLPAGVTWEWKGVADSGGETVMYPGLTKGGDLYVWGEVLDFTESGEGEETEEDESFSGFTGEVNYMVVEWGTKRNLYELYLADRENKAVIDRDTHKPRFGSLHAIGWSSGTIYFTFRDGVLVNGEQTKGKDPVTAASYHYTITLPQGMTWNEEELFKTIKSYPSPTGKVISVSGDGRTLVYEFETSITDNRYSGHMAGHTSSWPSPARGLCLGNSYVSSPVILIGEDYDFYHDLGQKITYKCTGTLYYQFSEPDKMQEVTAYEYLKPTDAGTVELRRRYAFQDNKRGRGLPMEISFVAENMGKDPAFVELYTVTDEPVNDNGYLYLTPAQMADVILGESEFLEAGEIKITEATLYQGCDYESGVTHTGTDAYAQINENLLNTYTEPTATNATLTLTVKWPETEAGSGDETDGTIEDTETGSRRPTGLTIKVNNGAETEIPFSQDKETLTASLEAALREAGYVIPTGYYHITWNATEAARSRVVGPYTDTEGKAYLWTIGSYHATVKTDYLQGHRWITYDSLGRMSLFSVNNNIPTAQAVFTLHDADDRSYQITEKVKDSSYPASNIVMQVRSIDSKTGNEVLVQDNRSQWICPGVVLNYRNTYQNGNSIPFGDMPFLQTLDRSQCLLAPVIEKNAALQGRYETISFRNREYYMLRPTEQEQELEGVWLGTEEGAFYAASVTIAGSAEGDKAESSSKTATQIRWYEKEIGVYGGGDDTRRYNIYAYVLEPETAGERPTAQSVVYANNYKSEAFSTRIFASYDGFYQSENIRKDMIANPEKAGTAEEKTTGDQRNSYLGSGSSVTYRLAFDEYWISDFKLDEGELYDLLPRTYGSFAWELGKNVEVSYALKERIVENGQENRYFSFAPDEGSEARIDTVEAQVIGKGEEVEQYRLTFGNLTIPYNRTLYIYVTLTFPEEQEVWKAFTDVADTSVYNCLYYGNLMSSIEHMLARSPQAFLKTGMYGTDGDPYGYIFANSDEKNRIVKYYVVLYNHGKSFLYLNPVHIQIPEGFKLEDPPKTDYNNHPDWNLGDVSVLDDDPPARSSRISINNVKVTYPSENEAALDITLVNPWNSYNHDSLVGKEFLRPGQYVAMEVRFTTDGYLQTPDEVSLPAAMPIDDYFHVDGITQVQGVDAHRSNYQNSNGGIPEFWEKNETAEERGFTVPDYADTGKWVASELKLTRENARPGVIKNAPTIKKVAQGEEKYDPQEGAAMEHPVKWESRLVNGGTNSLTDYRVKDSVQWPYVFDGEVSLSSQIRKEFDWGFTITRYTDEVVLEGGESATRIDRDRLKVGGREVRIAADRAEALAEGSGCYTEISYLYGEKARIYFYKEDAFGDGNPAETMEIDFGEHVYGIGPASYTNGRVIENARTLSYWTSFDLSKKNEAVRSSYANQIIMSPEQPYTKADVCEGIAIDENGEPVTGAEETPDGIMAVGYVSVNAGQSTAAWMKVKENKKPGEEDLGPEISDDIQAVLTQENKILQGDVDNTVTYTMHILNHVASGNDSVQSAEDRRYSIQNMVIMNTLPHVGDKMPFNSKIPRSSDYEIQPADGGRFDIRLFYYDEETQGASGSTQTDIPEDRLQEIDPACYQILYNENTRIDSKDWKFNANSGAGWNTQIPAELMANGWKMEEGLSDITAVKTVRIEIKDPNTVYDAGNPSVYRSLMKAGRTIVVKYQAQIKKQTDETGAVTGPTPGQCAWNSFGYRFERFDKGAAMEASSIRSGVQIPSIPILYEKLIDYDQNPYVNLGEPAEFSFTIDKQAVTDENGTTISPAQQLRFSVTVGTGDSENNKELRDIKDKEPEIVWWREEGDDSFFWEDGASYVVKQVTAPEDLPLFSVKVNGQSTTGFVYDPLYEPVIVVTNQSKFWSSQLYKMDSDSRGYDPTEEKDREHIHFLPDTLFGLYTTDPMQQVDMGQIREEAGDRYTWLERYKPLLYKMMETNYGNTPDTAVKLYLKDFCVTDSEGEVLWRNLEDDSYYVRELDPPAGFRLDETYYRINRKNAVLEVFDEPSIKFPVTGGIGTLPFYIAGGVLIAAETVYAERRGKRRRQTKKQGRAEQRKIIARAITLAMMVKILLRVIEIRRERRRNQREKKCR